MSPRGQCSLYNWFDENIIDRFGLEVCGALKSSWDFVVKDTVAYTHSSRRKTVMFIMLAMLSRDKEASSTVSVVNQVLNSHPSEPGKCLVGVRSYWTIGSKRTLNIGLVWKYATL